MKKYYALFALFLSVFSFGESAISAEDVGISKPWQLNFQEPASPVMEQLVSLHDGLLWMAFGISALVLFLLFYVMVKFNRKANPKPSKTTHNALVEVVWTVVPILILVAIIIPSWRLINYMDKVEDPEITLKAIGYQWYWGYEYMDGPGKGVAFESYMKLENAPEGQESLQLLEGEPRLLAVDNNIVLPVDTNIKLLTTSADVIHAFAMPALGVKMDAIPGRINETWFRITKPGMYYGQCSELCGSRHAFMPIAIKAVPRDEYLAWAKEQGSDVVEYLPATIESEESEDESEDVALAN
jgi:cytochrome c oxidase subunit 2